MHLWWPFAWSLGEGKPSYRQDESMKMLILVAQEADYMWKKDSDRDDYSRGVTVGTMRRGMGK